MEELKPVTYLENIQSRLDELKKLQIKLENSIKKAPKGQLVISASKKRIEFYETKNGKRNYISIKNMELVKQLAQANYEKKTCKTCRNEIKQLTKLIKKYNTKGYHGINTSNVYLSQNKIRQSLTIPVTATQKHCVTTWNALKYEPKEFFKNQVTYKTQKGECVRSKSEVIIANCLNANNIPYHYEYPLKTSHGIFYPDFYCLNLRTHQKIYWEHFGMMDDSNYANSSLQKLTILVNHNLIPGKNLILTFETSSTPISTEYINKMIHEFLV